MKKAGDGAIVGGTEAVDDRCGVDSNEVGACGDVASVGGGAGKVGALDGGDTSGAGGAGGGGNKGLVAFGGVILETRGVDMGLKIGESGYVHARRGRDPLREKATRRGEIEGRGEERGDEGSVGGPAGEGRGRRRYEAGIGEKVLGFDEVEAMERVGADGGGFSGDGGRG